MIKNNNGPRIDLFRTAAPTSRRTLTIEHYPKLDKMCSSSLEMFGFNLKIIPLNRVYQKF